MAVRRPMMNWRWRALLMRLVAFALAGAAMTLAIVFALSLWGAPELGVEGNAAGPHRGRHWHVNTFNSSGSMRLISTRQSPSWSAGQVTGPPDTPMNGDSTKAWCPATHNGQMEWLILDYPQAVVPRELSVYENCDPGALVRVALFDEAGAEIEAWQGVDPVPRGSGSGIAKIPLSAAFKIARVKIYIDSRTVDGWNEIDAVGLTDASGKTWWASGVQDSSSYGGNSMGAATVPGPAELVPGWCPVDEVSPTYPAATDVRIFEARGWPLLALWTERDMTSAAAANTTAPPAANLGGRGLGVSARTYRVSALTGTTGYNPVLPYRPIWFGLIFNILFFALFAAGIYWLLNRPRRLVMELLRMRRGCCIACGYELDFDFKGGCPECGWRREHAEHSHAR